MIRGDEVIEVCSQLLMAVVKEAFDSCFPDREVHSLDRTIGPGMIGFHQTMFDLVSCADHVEAHGTRPGRAPVAGLFGELDAIVR